MKANKNFSFQYNSELASKAFSALVEYLRFAHPTVVDAMLKELNDQRSNLKMIASENYCSLATQLTMGNWLTDKYSEGYVKHRFYAGCENVDVIEQEAIDQLKEIYGCDHAYVQPHSGCDANLIAFWAILMKRIQDPKLQGQRLDQLSSDDYEKIRLLFSQQTLMGMSLNSGGHLTHGFKHNVSGKMFRPVFYDVDPETHLLNYDNIREIAIKEKPLILLAGYSAYSRKINFRIMREIADEVKATFVVDMAHFSGLVAGKVFQGDFDPITHAHIVTSTTHKTLRGPRGGMILCQEEYKEWIDKGCPLVIGGPLPHVMAAKAVAFKEANTKEFQAYAHQIVSNAQALAEKLQTLGVAVVSGGTENHLVLMDVFEGFKLTGRQAEKALSDAHFTVNRNSVPNDTNGAWYTSGIRLGTAALTTRGLKEQEMELIAELLVKLLKATNAVEGSKAKYTIDESLLSSVKKDIETLLEKFPLYPELDFE